MDRVPQFPGTKRYAGFFQHYNDPFIPRTNDAELAQGHSGAGNIAAYSNDDAEELSLQEQGGDAEDIVELPQKKINSKLLLVAGLVTKNNWSEQEWTEVLDCGGHPYSYRDIQNFRDQQLKSLRYESTAFCSACITQLENVNAVCRNTMCILHKKKLTPSARYRPICIDRVCCAELFLPPCSCHPIISCRSRNLSIKPPAGYEQIQFEDVLEDDDYVLEQLGGRHVYFRKIRSSTSSMPLAEIQNKLTRRHQGILQAKKRFEHVTSAWEPSPQKSSSTVNVNYEDEDLFQPEEDDLLEQEEVDEEQFQSYQQAVPQKKKHDRNKKRTKKLIRHLKTNEPFAQCLHNLETLRTLIKIPQWENQFTIPLVGQPDGQKMSVRLGRFFSDMVKTNGRFRGLERWWSDAIRLAVSAVIDDESLSMVIIKAAPGAKENSIIMPPTILRNVLEMLLVVAGLHEMCSTYDQTQGHIAAAFTENFTCRATQTLKYLRRGRHRTLARPSARPTLYYVSSDDQSSGPV